MPVQTGVWEVGSRPPCIECFVGGGGRQLAVLLGPVDWESWPAGQQSMRGRAFLGTGPGGSGAPAGSRCFRTRDLLRSLV